MNEHKKLLLIGGTNLALGTAGIVERITVTRQDIIDAGYLVDEGVSLAQEAAAKGEELHIELMDEHEKQDLLLIATGMAYPINAPELPDCQAEPIIDEPQSWQQMNRGKMSKRQRRK